MNKELRKIVKKIEKRGYTVVPAGKHQKVKNAEGKTVCTLPTTPSGQTWRVRLLAELKRKGLVEDDD
jgi:hypothetical protein